MDGFISGEKSTFSNVTLHKLLANKTIQRAGESFSDCREALKGHDPYLYSEVGLSPQSVASLA